MSNLMAVPFTLCVTCRDDITDRCKIVPGAKQCAACLEEAGDVFRYRGFREACTDSGKHLGGVEHVIRTRNEAELANQLTQSDTEEDDGKEETEE